MATGKRRRPASSKSRQTATVAAATVPASPKKVFSVGVDDTPHGQKFIIYGASGIGKSSLAIMAPKPVLIPLDDGTAYIRDPFTHEFVKQVKDCRTFEDTRTALHQYDLFEDYNTVIIDTATKLQDLSHDYMFKTIKHEKGQTVSSIEGYGYGKGYSHMYDTMKLILQDADELIRRGKNVIFICQSSVRSIPNASGEDYLCNTVRLYPGSKNLPPISDLYLEWADHVFFINHANSIVTEKKIKGDVTRAVFTQGELHFKAKSRVLSSGITIPSVITFDSVDDDSVFRFIFGEVNDESEESAKVQAPAIPPEE